MSSYSKVVAAQCYKERIVTIVKNLFKKEFCWMQNNTMIQYSFCIPYFLVFGLNTEICRQREKSPNLKCFLMYIFLHPDYIWRFTLQIFVFSSNVEEKRASKNPPFGHFSCSGGNLPINLGIQQGYTKIWNIIDLHSIWFYAVAGVVLDVKESLT